MIRAISSTSKSHLELKVEDLMSQGLSPEEARAEAIHVKAITVNASDNGQLDRLYGAAHHTLIGNVHDLPDKLVRVYSALTRH